MDVLSAHSSSSNIVSKLQIKADNAYYKIGLAEAKNRKKNWEGKLLVASFKKIHSQQQLCRAETRPNFTYLHVAASLTLLDAVRSLLKHGASVDAREEAYGCTPLNVVCNSPDQLHIIQAFLEVPM
jgi:ankyrin repeat protein